MARRGPKAYPYRVKRILFMGAVYSFPTSVDYYNWVARCRLSRSIVDPVSCGARELFVPKAINTWEDV